MRTITFVILCLVLIGCKITIPDSIYLKCTATVSESEVSINTPVEITVTASGGVAPYYIQGNISSFNPTTVITREYDHIGNVNDAVVVNDSVGLTTQCGFSVVVKEETTPSLNLFAYPSTTVPVGSMIVVLATASGLGGRPNYVFTLEEPGVQMNTYDYFATFLSSDNRAHSFPVTVTASDSINSVTSTINLNFTALDDSLNCTISRSPLVDIYQHGWPYRFEVSATNQEELIISEVISEPDGAIEWATEGNNTIDITFYSEGTKTVKIKAKSRTRNVFCNNGEYMIDTFSIGSTPPAFSCNAYVDAYDYRVWYGFEPWWPWWLNFDDVLNDSVVVWAEVFGGGIGGQRITSLSATGNPNGHYITYRNDPLAKEVFFYDSGVFKITLTIKDDNLNQTTTCTTPSFRVWP